MLPAVIEMPMSVHVMRANSATKESPLHFLPVVRIQSFGLSGQAPRSDLLTVVLDFYGDTTRLRLYNMPSILLGIPAEEDA
jgi:hypothetical protein